MRSGTVKIRPFEFKNIPNISHHEAELLNALYRYFPPYAFGEGIQKPLENLLTTELGPSFSFQSTKISTAKFEELFKRLPKESVFLLVSLPPATVPLLCEVDLLLAHAILDRLLGGEGEGRSASLSLTEIEEGVLSFLVLKVLSLIYEESGRSARVHFRLQQFVSQTNDLRPFFPLETSFVELSSQIGFGHQGGYLRLYFPAPLVQKAFTGPAKDFSVEENRYEQARLRQLGFIRTQLWVEGGQAALSPEEIAQLKVGDVVLLDETELVLKGKRLEGNVHLKVGQAGRGALYGKICPNPKKIEIEIEGVFSE